MAKSTAVVLVALGCALCLGQQSVAPVAGSPAIGRQAPGRGGRIPKPPACPAKPEDSLETNGILPEGRAGGVRPPKVLFAPEAEFSEKTRKQINKKHLRPFFSVTLLSFVVDKDGNPQDLCVKKSGEFDLDEQAAKAVMRYRFEPAIKDGNPVAMRISTEISFAIR
jgi:TonB family protein